MDRWRYFGCLRGQIDLIALRYRFKLSLLLEDLPMVVRLWSSRAKHIKPLLLPRIVNFHFSADISEACWNLPCSDEALHPFLYTLLISYFRCPIKVHLIHVINGLQVLKRVSRASRRDMRYHLALCNCFLNLSIVLPLVDLRQASIEQIIFILEVTLLLAF